MILHVPRNFLISETSPAEAGKAQVQGLYKLLKPQGTLGLFSSEIPPGHPTLVLPGLPINGDSPRQSGSPTAPIALQTVDPIVATAGFRQHTAARGHGVGLSCGLLF